MNIVLMGVPGVGKSSVGKLLAAQMNREFIDTDTLLAARLYPMSLTEFFVEEGEMAFRKEEHAVLSSLLGRKDLILSLGGGTPTYAMNRELLGQIGKSIFLKADLETLLEHSKGALPGYLDSVEDFSRVVKERTELCEKCADLTLVIGKDSILEVTQKLMESLNGK